MIKKIIINLITKLVILILFFGCCYFGYEYFYKNKNVHEIKKDFENVVNNVTDNTKHLAKEIADYNIYNYFPLNNVSDSIMLQEILAFIMTIIFSLKSKVAQNATFSQRAFFYFKIITFQVIINLLFILLFSSINKFFSKGNFWHIVKKYGIYFCDIDFLIRFFIEPFVPLVINFLFKKS